MEKPVIIIGATGLGKVALDIFQSNQVIVYGFLDDDSSLHGKEINGITVLGSTEDDQYIDIIGDRCEAFIAIDENSFRKTMVEILNEKRKVMPVNAIHKKAVISESAYIGHGNFINSGITIGTNGKIGNHCILNANVLVDYNAEIGDFVQVGAGSVINSSVKVADDVFIGSGVTIVAGVAIGKGARIGAGSVVIRDVEENTTVFGNPAQQV